MRGRPWSAHANGLALSIRLTPKGGRDSIDGVETLSDGRSVLKVRVRALPMEGEANAALVKLLAKSLDVAPRAVNLTAGAIGRIKRVVIDGDAAALAARLERVLEQAKK